MDRVTIFLCLFILMVERSYQGKNHLYLRYVAPLCGGKVVFCRVDPPLHPGRDGKTRVVRVEGRGAREKNVADHTHGPDVTRLAIPKKEAK